MIAALWVRFRRTVERLLTGQTLQGRLAVLTGISVALAVLFVGTTAYLVTRWSLVNQLDAALITQANRAASVVRAQTQYDRVNEADILGTEQWVAVLTVTGTVPVSWGESEGQTFLPSDQETAVARLQGPSSTRTVEVAGRRFRMVAVPFSDADGNPSALLLVAPLTGLNQTLSSLWVVIALTGLTGVLVTTVAALLVARAALAPVHRLSQAVATVTQTDQLNPIRIYGRDDLGELTQSFNTMLKSLATSREQQRQLIADAGHELRTPLTSMRTNVELLVADDQSHMLPADARTEILGDVSAQLGEFSALIGDLVALTREDHLQHEPELLDMLEVTEAALERARRRGPGIEFIVDLHHSHILGDASTLERAITNLLDNAVKFSPANGTIWVTLDDGVLTIIDSGEGIAEDDLPHIFDRFYRSDSSRNTPGTGLGLSIVQHTTDAHKGTVRASNEPGAGAKFVLKIPTVDAPTPE